MFRPGIVTYGIGDAFIRPWAATAAWENASAAASLHTAWVTPLSITASVWSAGVRPSWRMGRPTAHDMFRPGIVTYGIGDQAEALGLRPVMSLKTVIGAVKDFVPDTTISYGRTFRTDRPSRVGVLPIAYADGLTKNGQPRRGRLLTSPVRRDGRATYRLWRTLSGAAGRGRGGRGGGLRAPQLRQRRGPSGGDHLLRADVRGEQAGAPDLYEKRVCLPSAAMAGLNLSPS